MFCSNCGKEIPDNAAICTGCGCWVHRTDTYQADYELMTNKMAVAGFICSFFSPLLGCIFGGIGLSRSKKRLNKGHGLSIAAIIISIVNFCVAEGNDLIINFLFGLF